MLPHCISLTLLCAVTIAAHPTPGDPVAFRLTLDEVCDILCLTGESSGHCVCQNGRGLYRNRRIPWVYDYQIPLLRPLLEDFTGHAPKDWDYLCYNMCMWKKKGGLACDCPMVIELAHYGDRTNTQPTDSNNSSATGTTHAMVNLTTERKTVTQSKITGRTPSSATTDTTSAVNMTTEVATTITSRTTINTSLAPTTTGPVATTSYLTTTTEPITTTETITTPSSEEICDILCRNDEGGTGCNCNLHPLGKRDLDDVGRLLVRPWLRYSAAPARHLSAGFSEANWGDLCKRLCSQSSGGDICYCNLFESYE